MYVQECSSDILGFNNAFFLTSVVFILYREEEESILDFSLFFSGNVVLLG